MIYNSILLTKSYMLDNYALQAKMSTASKYNLPLAQTKDIYYEYNSEHLIIKGPRNSIKVFLSKIFDTEH